ncbi:MAG: pyridoxal-dependent decarboxylase [Pseudomonadota bacterium]|nr:pyridoxal-dependent decarboxylase [Pseudomonadota bacterium]
MNSSKTSLDPADWHALREQGHQMLNDMFDHLEQVASRPVWQPVPDSIREAFREPLPGAPIPIEQVHARFMTQVLPHSVGNTHPRFMGWVHGGGTAEGMLAEMLAAGLNANCGGRDHMPMEVERQIVHWMRELFEFPASASGLLVTGSSMANLIGTLVARTHALGTASRRDGIAAGAPLLVAYTSAAAHGCVAQAMDIAGLGSNALRRVRVNDRHEIDKDALSQSIEADIAAGLQPFLIVGTAGTVDTGAIDDLDGLAGIARRHAVWFHVDGALGALGKLAPELASRFKGIERADSIALDFHKWGQVPYDAGFILVRDGAAQLDAFSSPAAYLARESRGLAAGGPWPCDLGPDLSRGFRALKVWFTFMTQGTARLGGAISATCGLARRMAERIASEPELELLAPVALNVVCFRYRCTDADRTNRAIVADLHESGIAVPSTTTINGKVAIRAAIVNHRTAASDVDALLAATLAFGRTRTRLLETAPA